MKLLPSETFAIDVPRPPAELADVIERQTGEPIRFAVRWPKDHEPFYGAVGPAGFRLRPVAAGTQGRPVVIGWFEPLAGATRVHVRVRTSVPLALALYGQAPAFFLLFLTALVAEPVPDLPTSVAAVSAAGLALAGLLLQHYLLRRSNTWCRGLLQEVLKEGGSTAMTNFDARTATT